MKIRCCRVVFNHSRSLYDFEWFNDPLFQKQWYWHRPIEGFEGRTDLLAAKKISNEGKRLRVGVIDTSFMETKDVTFAGGYSFFSGYGRSRHSDYLFNPDPEVCGDAHGLSVAGIIGSISNNEYDIAGLVDVDLIALSSMECGTGPMSDAADGLRWLAGGRVSGIPNIDTPVDIVNMSLAARGDYCPDFMQEAIDFAVSRGVTVTVAAGNDAELAGSYAPANCKNVITVGASTNQGNKADFSNYGSAVDIMAPGLSIYAPGPDDQQYSWDGTSQAAPIVAGLIAMAKSEFPSLVSEEIEDLLKLTAKPMTNETGSIATSCIDLDCGAGLINPAAFIKAAQEYMNSKNSYVKHAMFNAGECDDKPYKDFFGDISTLCGMTKVVFDAEATALPEGDAPTGVTYKLYAVPNDSAFYLSNAKLVLESDEPNSMVRDLGVFANNYGYLVCTNGKCDTKLNRMNTSESEKPDVCYE